MGNLQVCIRSSPKLGALATGRVKPAVPAGATLVRKSAVVSFLPTQRPQAAPALYSMNLNPFRIPQRILQQPAGPAQPRKEAGWPSSGNENRSGRYSGPLPAPARSALQPICFGLIDRAPQDLDNDIGQPPRQPAMEWGGRGGDPAGPLGGRADGENPRLSPVQSRWPATPIVWPGRESVQGAVPTSILAVWITPLPARESTQSRWKLPSGGVASEM